jgi:hypothetical protein
MTFLASTVISAASTALQDAGFIRWTKPELIGYLNDGRRALITVRPDVAPFMDSGVVPAAGARQSLPADAVALIDIIGNTNGKQRNITKVDIELVSSINRDWQSSSKSATARHFMYDLRDPFVYYLFPPSNGAGAIDMIYSKFPVDVAADTEELLIPIMWKNALTSYVLGRAYAKDMEAASNAAASAAYMASFTAELGGQSQSAQTVSPKV